MGRKRKLRTLYDEIREQYVRDEITLEQLEALIAAALLARTLYRAATAPRGRLSTPAEAAAKWSAGTAASDSAWAEALNECRYHPADAA